MVDEYQDTNKLQAYIVCFLASEHKNIMGKFVETESAGAEDLNNPIYRFYDIILAR